MNGSGNGPIPLPTEQADLRDIATEAARLASGDRDADYGDPSVNLARTGRMWGAILGIPDVTPEQVAMCMVAVKLSRQCHKPKRDNLVDAIGYLLCVDRIAEGS